MSPVVASCATAKTATLTVPRRPLGLDERRVELRRRLRLLVHLAQLRAAQSILGRGAAGRHTRVRRRSMSKPAEWVNPLDSVSTRTAAWFELAMAETPLSTSCCGIPRMVDVHDADRVGLRRVGHALQLLRDE